MSLIEGVAVSPDTEQGTAVTQKVGAQKAILVGSPGPPDCLSSSWKTFIRSGDLEEQA